MNRKWSWICTQLNSSDLRFVNDVQLMSLTYKRVHDNVQIFYKGQEWLLFPKTCSNRANKSAYVCSDPDAALSSFPRQRPFWIFAYTLRSNLCVRMFYKRGPRSLWSTGCWVSNMIYDTLMAQCSSFLLFSPGGLNISQSCLYWKYLIKVPNAKIRVQNNSFHLWRLNINTEVCHTSPLDHFSSSSLCEDDQKLAV